MTLSAIGHILKMTWKNFWFNKDKRKYRQKLIDSIENPMPLPKGARSERIIRLPFLPIQIFNTWTLDGVTYTILSRSHPKVYNFLIRRFGWDRITTNSTGSVVAQNQPVNSKEVSRGEVPKIAIAGCVLTGFEHAERWLRYYASLPEVHRIYWYVNAPCAPKSLLDLETEIAPLQLIPWDHEFKIARNHYLKTFQKGHALPAAYADSKFRAIQDGCTHLMHIDMDEFIHPISNLPKYATSKTTYFLSAYGKGICLHTDGSINVEETKVTNAESSSSNQCTGGGTSGDKSVNAFGKSIAPLYIDAVAPENHSYPTPNVELICIPQDTVMLHFLEMENVRSYPDHYPFSPLKELNIPDFTKSHLKLSREKSLEYITRTPAVYKA
ncbi:hypothetical protein N9L83_02790 [Flavobacteriales bacterium]|nr:hypothetical protein [Flavobacteriales bacterium]